MRLLNCRKIAGCGSEYLDGQLGRWARLELRLHLVLCPNCRHYVDQLEQTVETARALEAPELPDSAREDLLARFDRSRSGRS